MPYTIEVYTNSFEVTSLPDKVFHQYDGPSLPRLLRTKMRMKSPLLIIFFLMVVHFDVLVFVSHQLLGIAALQLL